MSDKIPLHKFETAKKMQKASDKFLVFMAIVTILLVASVAAWLAVALVTLLLPWPWAFWGVIIVGTVWFLWWAGLAIYNHYREIVEQGEKNGTIDE